MKAISTGNNDFKEIIEKDYYYVDKTQIIEDLLVSGKKSILFPRPRRFGKTLTMSMLDNFFNIEKKEDNKDLFKNLYIKESKYYELRGSIPVINISFKDLEEDNFELFIKSYKSLLVELYSSKKYLYKRLDENEKNYFDLIINGNGDIIDTKMALKRLMSYLKKYYNENVILLIDEYDVPIQNAYSKTKDLEEDNNYYKSLIEFFKVVFSSCAKDNRDLYMAIFTGVLRVSQESIFSGLNNFKVYGLMNSSFKEYFGFTESETKTLLEYYGLKLNNEVKNMYDGYNFNDVAIYNPWSILNYADDKVLSPFWLNTSSNILIKNILKNTTIDNKMIIESLAEGESVEFMYDENITYKDLSNNYDINAILNVMLASGYLTKDREEIVNNTTRTYLKIPNLEVKRIISSIMLEDINKDNSIVFSNQIKVV